MKFLAVDGNSILNRAFYGIKLLTTKDGMYTNGIYGFLSILYKMMEEVRPDYIAIAFDMRAPTFRHQKYDGYKANRKGMPEELAVQLPVLKEILSLLGFRLVEKEGFEADDILGTLARVCGEQEVECVLATGDRDSFQLISDQVTVRLATNRETIAYTPEKIRQEYGIAPIQFIELKALMGDTSDNIPGVKGIGEKTALSLIQKYQNVAYIYAHLEELEVTPRIRKLLEEGREMAELSRFLGKICTDAPVETTLQSYSRRPVQTAEAAQALRKLEMYAMLDKWGLNQPVSQENPAEEAAAPAFTVLQSPDYRETAQKLSEMRTIDFLASPAQDGGIGRLLIRTPDGAAEYVFQAADAFEKLVLNSGKPCRTYDTKAFYHMLAQSGLSWPDGQAGRTSFQFDPMLAAYLLDANAKSYSMSLLAQKYLPEDKPLALESYQDIYVLPALCEKLEEEIVAREMEFLLYEIEIPLAEVLADMERTGFGVDRKGIAAFGEILELRIEQLRQEMFRMAGREFNPNSTRELGEILFEKLGLPAGKKTKTGYSTGAEVLEKLQGQHPIIGVILEYRQLTKLQSTYVTGLLKVIGADGRIHTVFKQTETRTGRISSTEPNMQNIPIRTELGREMRRFFVARPGYCLLDADYSQIELRILAHISGDEAMIEGFRRGADIHTMTASQVFGVPFEAVPPELRRRAKAINFGIVYGIGAYSLSQDIQVSVAEAKAYIEHYLDTYRGVKHYMEHVVEQASKDGYATTMFGRRRELPELASSNRNLRAFGERVALNAPIQGTAADIIKIAMVHVFRRLREEKLDAKLILQVHDELLIEVAQADKKRAAEILRQEMEHAASLRVPLVADVSEGANWYEAKE
ncbi:MAG TPA: DNA polymerase I [Firmicutes bacterium]|nr:DNA polymerase I [Bacillota bacterium]